jgi:peptide-methionine (S)-S-oxide reductase
MIAPGRTLRPVALSCAAIALAALGMIACQPVARSAPKPTVAASAARDTAVFAGGCFWSMQTDFERVPGVTATIVGYTGGHTVNPSYEDVTTETTGHRESIEVVFDPARTSYPRLVDLYWHSIDPTQPDGQMFDRGSSYETAIFVRNAAQRQAALASKQAIEAAHTLKAPIATVILPAAPFYRAEDYHQDYGRKNPLQYRAYRVGSGRDARLDAVWGKAAAHPDGF